VLHFNYNSGIDSDISRLSSISDETGIVESYTYLGLGAIVQFSHPQINNALTYIRKNGAIRGFRRGEPLAAGQRDLPQRQGAELQLIPEALRSIPPYFFCAIGVTFDSFFPIPRRVFCLSPFRIVVLWRPRRSFALGITSAGANHDRPHFFISRCFGCLSAARTRS
jgi:hypothetical protein